MTMMADLPGSLGFARPRTENTLSRRRAATIDLIATFSLTVSLVIAVTAVSLGNRSLARMEALERPSVQTPIGALLDQTDGWLSLRAQQ
jgi:hypothetical protein